MDSPFRVRVLRAVVEVSLDASVPEETRRQIRHQWAHLVVEDEAPSSRLRLRLAGATATGATDDTVIAAANAADAPDVLAGVLTRRGLEHLTGHAFMFHAAGLSTADGGVVALVGPSGRGKTTASMHLGREMGYVSDETVAFTDDLRVIPYPKPLSVGSRPGMKTLHAPTDVGLRVAREPLRLAALVLLDRDEGVTTPTLEAVPIVEAIGDLVGQTSSLSALPRPLHALLRVIDHTGGVRRLRYRDVADLDDLIARIPSVRHASVPWHSVDEPGQHEPGQQAHLHPGAFGRAAFVDAAVVDERMLVLAHDAVTVLDGIGPALWRAADGVPFAEICRRTTVALGDAPPGVDVDHAVRAGLTELVAAGVVREQP